MKIKADALTATTKGLHVGLRIEWNENGPVRFQEVIVPWGLMDRSARAEVVAALNRQVDITPEDTPLF